MRLLDGRGELGIFILGFGGYVVVRFEYRMFTVALFRTRLASVVWIERGVG